MCLQASPFGTNYSPLSNLVIPYGVHPDHNNLLMKTTPLTHALLHRLVRGNSSQHTGHSTAIKKVEMYLYR